MPLGPPSFHPYTIALIHMSLSKFAYICIQLEKSAQLKIVSLEMVDANQYGNLDSDADPLSHDFFQTS